MGRTDEIIWYENLVKTLTTPAGQGRVFLKNNILATPFTGTIYRRNALSRSWVIVIIVLLIKCCCYSQHWRV